jgi:hypothetical protein
MEVDVILFRQRDNAMHAILDHCGPYGDGRGGRQCVGVDWQSTERVKLVQSNPETLPAVRIFLRNGVYASVCVSVGMVHKTPGITAIHLTIQAPFHPRPVSNGADVDYLCPAIETEVCTTRSTVSSWPRY